MVHAQKIPNGWLHNIFNRRFSDRVLDGLAGLAHQRPLYQMGEEDQQHYSQARQKRGGFQKSTERLAHFLAYVYPQIEVF